MKPVLVVTLSMFFAACAGAPTSVDVQTVQTQAAQTVIARLVTSTLAIPATLTCDPRPFLKATADTIDQFADVRKRANASPRISLSPVVGEMQDLRRQYKNSIAPACGERLQVLVVAAMDAEITTYIDFMSQQSDYVVQADMRVADLAWQEVSREMKEIGYTLGTPRPPTLPPTIVPTPSKTPLPSATPVRPLNFIIHSVERMMTYADQTPQAGNVFLVFTVTIQNNEAKTQTVSAKQFYVSDKHGIVSLLRGDKAEISIPPKGTVEQTWFVEVGDSAQGFTLVYDDVNDRSGAIMSTFPTP